MRGWECGVGECEAVFGEVEDLLDHQVAAHGTTECAVCGAAVPRGFFAIRHAFGEHTRADYVRAYDADADDIRHRENLIEAVEALVDVDAIRERLS